MSPRDALKLAQTSVGRQSDQIDIDLSVIIVSWNVRDFLLRCIESIFATRGDASVEIIVVDNASSDGSPEMVRTEFEEAHVIKNSSNLGFGPANNVGLAHARGRYVFFLNPDTLLRDRALTGMCDFLDYEPGFDMVGPCLVDPDGTTQRACARTLPSITLTLFEALYLHRLPVVGQRVSDRLISPYNLAKSQEVDAISGAAMFARREVIEQLGGFDEAFLHTAEDMDLCLRLRRSGSRIFYLADAHIIHFGGQSSALVSVRAGTMSIISMREYFGRSRGRRHALMYRLIVQVVQMPMLLLVGVGKAILRRDPEALRERLRFARAVWAWRVGE